MRVFLVGTDTGCGKTTVACALLQAARAEGLVGLPFKPAASGPEGPEADPECLVAAARLPGLTVRSMCPQRFPAPVAPGLACDTDLFTQGSVDPARWASDCDPVLAAATTALATLEQQYQPDVTVIEGAGGLWVPMPGGTWLPRWIRELDARPVVVGRLGLGTINHCLLTIFGLRQLGLAPVGFVLAQTTPTPEPCHVHNEAVIAAASGLPCLGVLGFAATGPWLRPTAWSVLGVTRPAGEHSRREHPESYRGKQSPGTP